MSNEIKVERKNTVELYTSILRYVWDNSDKETQFITKPIVLETNYLLGRTSSPKCANQWFKDNRADTGSYKLPEIVVDLTDIINGSRLRSDVKKPTNFKTVSSNVVVSNKEADFKKGLEILKDLADNVNNGSFDEDEIIEEETIIEDDEDLHIKFDNILCQLYKSLDSDSTIKTVFEDGEVLIVPKEVAEMGVALLTSEDYKTEHRLMFQTYCGQSYANLLEMIEQYK
jgi:hypothetical protein